MTVIASYLWWQYQGGLQEVVRAWMNVHWFLYNYFSIPLLMRSFFAPFHRMQETKKRGFDPENIMEIVIINTVMRVIGMLVRAVFIFIGLVAEVMLLIVGLFVFLSAVASPVLIPGTIGVGLAMLLL